jgi:hypothetical protein
MNNQVNLNMISIMYDRFGCELLENGFAFNTNKKILNDYVFLL